MFEFLKRSSSAPAPDSRAEALAAAFPKPPARRSFDAAAINRLTASWVGSIESLNEDLRGQLDRIRARSRDMAKNNEFAKKFLRMCADNIVGPEGFVLQGRAVNAEGKPDRADNDAIEWAWHRWCKVADIRGRQHFTDILRTLVKTLARDGEFIVALYVVNQQLRLRMIDPATLDATLNVDRASNGNRIVMGVEVDELDRPVAYHFRKRNSTVRERVLADGIIHCFVVEDADQHRGVPWMHAVMRRMHDLNGYREAAVIAARVGAAKCGVWETPDGLPPGAESDPNAPMPMTDAEPGHFDYAPPGYKLAKFDPTYPHDQFDSFCKEAVRGIASGLGVSYPGLGNNLEGVNYSSIRAGMLEERDAWMSLQNWLIHVFLEPLYARWIELALLAKEITLPNGSPLPDTKKNKFLEHHWQPRRWAWVDPLKDMNAAIAAINAGLASPQQIAAQAGRDVEDVLDDLQRFNEMLQQRGLRLGSLGFAPDPDELREQA